MMNNGFSLSSLAAQAHEWLEWLSERAASATELGIAEMVERFPDLPQYLPQLFEFCVLTLAIAALLLARRARRDRRALRGLLRELQSQQDQLRGFAAVCATLEEKITRSLSAAK